MAKAVAPGSIQIPGVEAPFSANAVPDPFDERDLEYRPRLEPLPPVIDQRDPDKAHFVLQQQGNSCTGHAVAAVINTVLARAQRRALGASGASAPPIDRASPYMLYRLARRYDEFRGEKDVGSSLRGAFKGWFHHGVVTEKDWPALDMHPEPDLDDPAFARKCRERPLGAFYRVNPYRLDDMQSAISELNAIAVSASIHEGWVQPQPLQRGDQTMYVIQRPVNAGTLGGHAFCLAGYNEVGFLVQNSWGTGWGKGGFATLPYEDWLDSAYDAWVARPGVPQTPFYAGRTRTAQATGGQIAIGPGVDLKRLGVHVVNLGNNGRLSQTGNFTSSPAQIERIFTNMERWHDFWLQRQPDLKRHVILYAHGGLTSEEMGLQTCQRHLNWWLNNHVYPIYFAWETDAASTVMDRLYDLVHGKLPFGGLGFDLIEQFDRLVENVVRGGLRWVWEEMKHNARAASEPIANADAIQWPPPDGAAMTDVPGASLVVTRLKQYVSAHGAEKVGVHLVGHSAGSIFHAAILQRLVEAGIKVDSIQFLAPGLRVDEFVRDIVPHLGDGGHVERFANFDLTNSRELADSCPINGTDIYHKSLLYLVARAFDELLLPSGAEAYEVPLIGMEIFFDRPLDGPGGQTLKQLLDQRGAKFIFAPSAAPDDCRSDAMHHGGIHEDGPTMTSVVMRVLDVTTASPEYEYQTNAALKDADQAPTLEGEGEPAPAAAGVQPPGATPLVEMAETQRQQPHAPAPIMARGLEVAVAPRTGSPILDLLQSEGWRPFTPPPPADGGTGTTAAPTSDTLGGDGMSAAKPTPTKSESATTPAVPTPTRGATGTTAARPMPRKRKSSAKGVRSKRAAGRKPTGSRPSRKRR